MMQKTRQDYIDLLNETIDWYVKNPRSTHNDMCLYYNKKNGAMCAVGRCMENPRKLIEDGVLLSNAGFDEILDLEETLKPEYRGFDLEFWGYLQNLHDASHYWNQQENALSSDGESYKEYIIKNLDEFLQY
jgi:hypothetical protein